MVTVKVESYPLTDGSSVYSVILQTKDTVIRVHASTEGAAFNLVNFLTSEQRFLNTKAI